MSKFPKFSQRLRERREAAGLTPKQLAEKLGIPTRRISQLESGGDAPVPDTLRKMARTLSTSYDYLIGATDDPAPRPRKSRGVRRREGEEAADTTTPGGRIRKRREEMGVLQSVLSEQTGVSEPHVSGIERGKRDIHTLKVGTLVAICQPLDLSLDYVVKGEE